MNISGRVPKLRTTSLVTLLVIASLAAATPARARTTIVPDDFPTIQAAVDYFSESPAADTLLVRGGDYPERVSFSHGIRVEAIPSLDGTDLVPRIQELWAGSDSGDHLLFIGLHFTQKVLYGASGPAKFHFIRCCFDAGIASGAMPWDGETDEVALSRCTLYQTVWLGAYDGVLDSCTVYGPVVMLTPYHATIVDNVCENVGSIYIRSREVVAARNRIRGGEHAFVIEPEDALWSAQILDNDIEGCSGYGVHVNGDYDPVRLERNRIARCGGFGAKLIGNVIARDNRVTDCRGSGLELVQTARTGLAERNVAGRCDAGIQISNAWGEHADFTVRENTVYGCGGPGLAIVDLPGSTITRNIVYECGGFSATSSEPLNVSCNDWFPVPGAPAATSDLSVDPQFCDVVTDDFQLRSDSPLLDAPGCGRIGALGQGCEAPVVAMGFAMWPHVLQPSSRARRVMAFLEPPPEFPLAEIDVASVRVNGVPLGGVETVFGDKDKDGVPDLQLQFDRASLERTLGPGSEVSIAITGRIGRRNFSGTDKIRVLRYSGGPQSEIPRDAARDRMLSIRAPLSSVRGLTRVEFTLADETPARLEVLDVAGRMLSSYDVGQRQPGEYSVALARDGLAQGIYFLRLRQGVSEVSARVLVVR